MLAVENEIARYRAMFAKFYYIVMLQAPCTDILSVHPENGIATFFDDMRIAGPVYSGKDIVGRFSRSGNTNPDQTVRAKHQISSGLPQPGNRTPRWPGQVFDHRNNTRRVPFRSFVQGWSFHDGYERPKL